MATFSARTLKQLWGRAAARCAFPDCRIHLFEDASQTDDDAIIGENCHIVGESEEGPRGTPSIPVKQRDSYSNLILLCRNHHRIIDQQVATYSVEILHRLKFQHETWVRETLTDFDPARQRDEERYAAMMDEWVTRCNVASWEAWTSWMLSAQPRISVEMEERLDNARKWLLNRFWPGRYPALEAAFGNFRLVLSDLLRTFHQHSEKRSEGYYTEKFYKLQWHQDHDVYSKLVDDYDNHIALVTDLGFELTRASNYIIEQYREKISPSYFEDEGLLTVQSGPDSNLVWHTYVPRYTAQNLESDPPYSGLEDFKRSLATRDFHFSSASTPEAP